MRKVGDLKFEVVKWQRGFSALKKAFAGPSKGHDESGSSNAEPASGAGGSSAQAKQGDAEESGTTG